jgi:hypothetical protein
MNFERALLDPTSRLRIATRIHFGLMRHYGEAVEIRSLLEGAAEAREALWVCEASDDDELVALARQLKQANRRPAAPAKPIETKSAAPRAAGRTPQDTAWSRNTTGFGVSDLADLGHAGDGTSASWLHPSSWFGALR